jgi:hypothetical protein
LVGGAGGTFDWRLTAAETLPIARTSVRRRRNAMLLQRNTPGKDPLSL